MKRLIYIIFIFFLGCSFQDKNLIMKKGLIDLSKYDFEKGPVLLSGNWIFHCGSLKLEKEQHDLSTESFMSVPSSWKSRKDCKRVGKATYQATVKLPKYKKLVNLFFMGVNGHYKVFFNRTLVKESFFEDDRTGIQPFQTVYRYDENQSELDIAIHISNEKKITSYPGILRNIYIGNYSDLNIINYRTLFYELLLSLGIFFFILFLFYNGLVYYEFEKKLVFLFILYNLLTFSYLLMVNTSPFLSTNFLFVKFFSQKAYFLINAFNVVLFPFLFFLFLYSFFHYENDYFKFFIFIKIAISSLLFTGVVMIASFRWYPIEIMVLPVQIDFIFSIVFILMMNWINFQDKKEFRYEIGLSSIFYIFVITTSVTLERADFTLFSERFLFSFVPLFFSMSFLGLGFFRYLVFKNKEIAEQRVKKVKDSFNKLIPQKIIELNQIDELIDLRNNKQVRKQIVFFFIKFIPNLDFEKDFFNGDSTHFNFYYEKINKIILKYSGMNFSYTYENDLLAIFEVPMKAMKAAKEITKIDFQNLKVVIAFHTHLSQMKAVGIRTDSRIIFDPFYIENILADLIFEATEYNIQIVGSESFISQLPLQNEKAIESRSNEFYYRPINLCSKGYFEEIIYEIFENSVENRIKFKTIKLHNQAYNYIINGRLESAVRIWTSILKISPEDQLILSLMKRYRILSEKEGTKK